MSAMPHPVAVNRCTCGHMDRKHAGQGWCSVERCPCNGGTQRTPEPGATYSEEGRRLR